MSVIVNNVTEYTNYFRGHAVRHKDIKHNPDSEIKDTGKEDMRFSSWNLDELISGSRSKVSFPALKIESFEIGTNAETTLDIRLKTKGAFSVITHLDVDSNIQDEEQASALAYQILMEILQQIYQDHHGSDATLCNTPFKQFDFNELDIVKIPIHGDKEIGWRCEFNFKFKNSIDIKKKPAEGTFID